MLSLFGNSKTKFFAAVVAILQSLEVTEVIPAGSFQSIVDVLKAIAAAGVVFGFRDAVAKVGK